MYRKITAVLAIAAAAGLAALLARGATARSAAKQQRIAMRSNPKPAPSRSDRSRPPRSAGKGSSTCAASCSPVAGRRMAWRE